MSPSEPRTCTRARLVEPPLADGDRVALLIFDYDAPLAATPCAAWDVEPPEGPSPPDPLPAPPRD